MEGGMGLMVRLVSCGVRECRQTMIDSERETKTIANKKWKEGSKLTCMDVRGVPVR
jgi:hypothetical protein